MPPIDTPRTVTVTPPPVTQQRAPETPTVSDSTLIARVVQSYARAIESRDVEAVRRAYPGLSSAQQRGFVQFFQATRALQVSFSIARLTMTDSSADARVTGTYEYATSRGETREPVAFDATLRKESGVWRLVEVK